MESGLKGTRFLQLGRRKVQQSDFEWIVFDDYKQQTDDGHNVRLYMRTKY